MFGDEANTDFMAVLNVMQQIEEAPNKDEGYCFRHSFDAMAQLGLKQPCDSFVWLIGEVLV